METYYYVIYFRDGRTHQSGGFNQEIDCERAAIRQFDFFLKGAINEYFEPVRYVVKKR